MNRRELLLLGIHRKRRSVELSCERLYMKYCDSRLDDTTGELFERLDLELREAAHVVLTDTAWLASEEFSRRIQPLLDSVRSRGGSVEDFTEQVPAIKSKS
jgi:hypothetical protein